MVFAPKIRAVLKLQLVVPAAGTRAAPFKLYSTKSTLLLSDAVPLMVIFGLMVLLLLLGLLMLIIGAGSGVAVVKVAVAVWFWFMAKVQIGFVPEHDPPQPAKLEPISGVAVRVTLVLFAYVSMQSFPQVIPLGTEVILPVPDLLTTNTNVGLVLNVAVTV